MILHVKRALMWRFRFVLAVVGLINAVLLMPVRGLAETNTVFRVMTFNIHHAEGLDGNIETRRIADLILAQRADLVGLNEVDRWTTRTGGRDLIGELAQQTGMAYVFSNNLSYQGGEYGNAILSRHPILSSEHRLLPKVGSNEQRGWLKAVVDVNGKFVSFWVTHLAAVADETERLMCVTNFNAWLSAETLPVICCGDFNATPGSATCTLMATKWSDAWLMAGSGNGRTAPVPTPTKRIDYIWTGRGAPVAVRAASVPYTEASDHFPVVAELALTNSSDHLTAFHFPFDEGAGSNVLDLAAGLAGVFDVGAPAWSTDSPTGLPGDFSLCFSGTSRISVPDPAQILGTNEVNGDYTLQAWVRLQPAFSPPARMILFQYERVPGFSFSISTNRTLHTTTFRVKDIPSEAVLPDDGKWHHAAVVHTDRVSMKFYVDGQLAATVAYTNGVGFRISSTVTIGSSAVGANPFTGWLDRISFENRALIPEELDYPAMPTLGIRQEGERVIVFWRTRRTPYALEANSRLQASGWTNVTVHLQGNESSSAIQGTNTAMFYRLRMAQPVQH